jgi:hypothetical protein
MMNLIMISYDMVSEITKELSLDSLQIFLSSCKDLYVNRFNYIKENKIIQKYSKYNNGDYYFNVMYNSYITSCNTEELPLIKVEKREKQIIHNTIDIITFIMNENIIYQDLKYIEGYIEDILYVNTNLHFAKNEIIIYLNSILNINILYTTDIYVYDILEILLYAKHRKFKNVYQCMLNLKIKSINNFEITLGLLLNIFEKIKNKQSRFIYIYIIYEYISKCELISNKIINIISYKTDEFMINLSETKILPKYMKSFIISKLLTTKEKLCK